MSPVYRWLALIALCALAVLWLRGPGPAEGGIDADVRAAGLTWAPDVSAADRAWIEAAIAAARPEARTLIDEIDGTVRIQTHTNQALRSAGRSPGPRARS